MKLTKIGAGALLRKCNLCGAKPKGLCEAVNKHTTEPEFVPHLSKGAWAHGVHNMRLIDNEFEQHSAAAEPEDIMMALLSEPQGGKGK
ncbi:MAG: hypothetical protein L0Z53_06685 [Acidobacteriales bacterium]|nr:hypothetical protein [Terriglobales bacterium]